MLQAAQTLPHHLTKIDTLQDQINHLKHVVDSLNTISATTTIGTGYFHDIIGGVIMIFILILTIIVTIAGLINWNVLLKRFDRMTENVKNELEKRIEENEKSFEQLTSTFENNINSLKDQTLKLQYDAGRAMYFALKEESPAAAMGWALGVIESALVAENIERANDWLGGLEAVLDKITKEEMIYHFEEQKESFASLKQMLENEELKRLNKIEEGVFKIMFSA
ncbi:hypothetical protein AAFN85_03830 [Mucilaginibacter sp. CAU 1740]|uniref:hypothetical protein n=1 Tax=Mucilaginibacter sp. CAU 1740 TaxID=3140365 RepID=UPI00325BB0DC